MKHPFEILRSEYTQLLSVMVVRPEVRHHVDKVAGDILSYRTRFADVEDATGVPIIFSGPSFYREADLNFDFSPAQGDSWRRVSRHVPEGRGPFPSWKAAAIDAYHLNGLEKIGRGNWTWELVCFYGELFNGLGYRDWHHMHSPYLWGGTNIQTVGKYTSDGHFDAEHMDTQLGIIPIARRIVELAPDLSLGSTLAIPAPQKSGLAKSEVGDNFTKWVQESLNIVGFHPPLVVNGNYDQATKRAVHAFEMFYGLDVDGGYAGPQVIEALRKARAELEHHETTPAPAPSPIVTTL